jgi:beta-xylosidase
MSMKKSLNLFCMIACLIFHHAIWAQKTKTQNPILFADVPDMSMIRVGNIYYMSSTTMHMSPGLPIMKSSDLVNWTLLNYAYDTLANMPELNLTEGKNAYGRGSWASSLRFHNGMYYVTTFSQTSGKTYIFKTKNIDQGSWEKISFSPSYHDHSLFFDDNGKSYLIYGVGKLKLLELNDDLTGVRTGTTEKVIIENASAPAGTDIGLQAEGSQLYKINGRYYLFNICWPRNGMRTVIIHRADLINGPWEGKVGFQDLGVAQGGLIDMPDGRWYAYLFRDFGAVGRIPYLVPVNWEDGWPILGDYGKLPGSLNLPKSKGLIHRIVDSDEFNRKKGRPMWPLIWQWNHNPDNNLWSLNERKGYLRLKTGRIDTSILVARNTLTQRTTGPTCSGSIALDVTNMKEGDFAGLTVLQKNFGSVGVKINNGIKEVVMVSAGTGAPIEVQRIPLLQNRIYFKINCDFTDKKDIAYFYYSLDDIHWNDIGEPLKMKYTLPHFMGYRFGIFNYATKIIGGYADFDWFHYSDRMEQIKQK